MITEFEHIRYEVADGIATVTLNRPDVLNAQTKRMHAEVIAAADRWDAEAPVSNAAQPRHA